MNHRQIAELPGVDRSTYSKYENGVTEPAIDTLVKLRHIFNVSYEELLEAEPGETAYANYDMVKKKKRF